jgi:Holliday junction resolvase RusA-like endonuclease
MTSEKTVITLPFPVSVNAMYSNGRSGRLKSPRYEAWLTEAGYALMVQRPVRIKGPVTLSYEVQDGSDGRRRDIGNLEKGPTDLLVAHGIIEGDHDQIVREINLRWCQNVSGIRVTITPIKDAV